jgi:uncharacterized membrane protein YkvA (DUF1232 family)
VSILSRLRGWAKALKRDAVALWLASRDPRVPWYAKALAGGVAAYALSPLDLIPDFIPIVGYLDDLILVPLGVALAVRMIPADVMADLRGQADRVMERPRSRVGAVLIITIWAAVTALAGFLAWPIAKRWLAN